MTFDLSNLSDMEKAYDYLMGLVDKGAKAKITRIKTKRTVSQNSYLHVCFGLICTETGYSIQECKTVLKRVYGLSYKKNGNTFLKSTADLDTGEMTKFIDWIRAFSLDQLGAYIPTPDEYLQNQFEIDKQLEHIT